MRAIPPFGATTVYVRILDNPPGAVENCMYTNE